MTQREAPSPEFIAAYMAACANRPADWNEIGYWYARQCWDASRQQALEEEKPARLKAWETAWDACRKQTVEECAYIAEQKFRRAADGNQIADAIRSLTSPIGDKA